MAHKGFNQVSPKTVSVTTLHGGPARSFAEANLCLNMAIKGSPRYIAHGSRMRASHPSV